ncbi:MULTISPECIES: RidA family protein [unclassified Mesorhizobium]|uniref:RidA family protein n=1 Tax=unclassified Mesorhizobium TaxID=325217 RepID=UPI00241521D2|nr:MULTISPECIES: RidA family protein [unclassified Mesorhizobium]MDG4889915.1 RidA family protein [Mesorhizobium sp. WSM4887]MDG4904058.1 RidA family protein [Mesorhizobium sp. WSM4962]MDG4909085.1 RidA family protein [Mesorhizobium sp. WSM4898]MDG4921709.1 RidA family protein [Mesorhizobium sp. WSM4989]
MPITRHQIGTRMSQAVICNGIAFLAGQVAHGARGASVHEQTLDILARIDALLAEIGTSKDRLLSATVWLADIATFNEMNAVWDAWVSKGNTPARACVEARLGSPDFTVEIMATAACGANA